jgi:uncharacterized protein YndB with AHSA1/START domain
MTSATHPDQEVRISRELAAPLELVYRAWTEREMLERWYAPHGCTLELVRMDLREGGGFHQCIRNPKHGDCWVVGTFLEVVPPERLVYSLTFSDEAGRRLTPAQAGRELDWPEEVLTTVTFEDLGDRTRVTIHQTVSEALAKRTGALPSWLQMLDRLELAVGMGRTQKP